MTQQQILEYLKRNPGKTVPEIRKALKGVTDIGGKISQLRKHKAVTRITDPIGAPRRMVYYYAAEAEEEE